MLSFLISKGIKITIINCCKYYFDYIDLEQPDMAVVCINKVVYGDRYITLYRTTASLTIRQSGGKIKLMMKEGEAV